MNCCICGPVKNCGPYLTKVFENIEKIGSLFDDYKILIFYSLFESNPNLKNHHRWFQFFLWYKFFY